MMKSGFFHTAFLRAGRVAAAAFVLLPTVAAAHPGHYHPDENDEFDSFGAGLLHPLTGLDHLLLALAIGWLAFLPARFKARMGVTTFVAAITAGAAISHGSQGGMALEILIASTLLLAGVGTLLAKRSKETLILPMIAAAGVIHGFAHGAEAPGGFLPYIAGILTGSALLAASGAWLHSLTREQPLPARVAACTLLAAGGHFLFQAL